VRGEKPTVFLFLQQRATHTIGDGIVALLVLDVLVGATQTTWGQTLRVVRGVLGRTGHAVQTHLEVEDACWVGPGVGTSHGDDISRLVRAGTAPALDQNHENCQQETDDHSVDQHLSKLEYHLQIVYIFFKSGGPEVRLVLDTATSFFFQF